MQQLFRSIIILGCIVGLVGVTSMAGKTSENQESWMVDDISKLTSPDDIEKFRNHYLENFDRIGLNTAPGDARFLRIIVQSMKAKRGIEVGSATGYGALFMGMGFEHTGGELITIDISPKMVKACRENIKKMGLEKTVKCVEGDALEVIPKLEGKFDFVFIDALKEDYFKYFKAISPMLLPGAVIVADNVIKFENQMKDFLDFMENDPAYDIQIFQSSELKDDGMAIIYKKR